MHKVTDATHASATTCVDNEYVITGDSPFVGQRSSSSWKSVMELVLVLVLGFAVFTYVFIASIWTKSRRKRRLYQYLLRKWVRYIDLCRWVSNSNSNFKFHSFKSCCSCTPNFNFFLIHVCRPIVFTARCTIHVVQTAKHGLAIACRLSVCLSVCNVGGSWPHRLKILETNCANN